ncbi:hypothetical protein [Aestuariispira ectoiniformans]|uniref:hypothetical protein n=1 Tax=Aestuariispira ectoiniformans TaxID=2775080 RepID=UPI00223BEB24|nr:hypothetical protein [Aestuariispira ectoiniformans]
MIETTNGGEAEHLDDPDKFTRRSKLETVANPNAGIDYLCSLSAHAQDDRAIIHIRYVPDKLLLPTQSFGQYLHDLHLAAETSLEELALTILDDINNEVVPRWVQIRVDADEKSLDRGHRTLIEDRQPRWDNKALLARVELF